MKKNIYTILMFCSMLCSVPVMAQNYIGSNSVLELIPSGGRIGLSLEPGTPIEGDVLTLKGGDSFSVMAGTISGGSSFDGKVAVGLIRNGAIVEILAEQALGVSGNTTLFFDCKISESIQVLEGDVIRLLSTSGSNGRYQAINSTYGGVVTQIPATNYEIPFHKINIPETVPGATIKPGSTVLYRDKIVRGRNYAFYVTPNKSTYTVIVEANGQPVAEQYGYYALNNVQGDIDVSIRVFDPDTAVTYREIHVTDEKRIIDLLEQWQMDCLSHIKVTGYMTHSDVYTIRDKMPTVSIIDLTEATIENNSMPEFALNYRASVKKLFLPNSVEMLGNNAFYGMTGLSFIVLPENLNLFGYNQFYGCSNLKTVWVKWNPSAHGHTSAFPIPPCAFRSTPYSYEGTLIVPQGALDAYKSAANWSNFHTIREELPIDKIMYSAPVVTGVDDIYETLNNVTITSADGGFILSNNDNAVLKVIVYALDGTVCAKQKTVEGESFVALPPGLYMVVVGNVSQKILVK